MSTKNVARNSDMQPRSADEVDLRRARTRLLAGPVLNLLRSYRRDVLTHLDRTIAQLEEVEAWSVGGDAPAAAAFLGKLAERVYCRAQNDSDEERQLAELVDGPVLLCEVALTELCRQAFGDQPRMLGEAATMIASALRHSEPNHESNTYESDTWFETLEQEAKAAGFEVDCERICAVIKASENEVKARVHHA